ncbi:MAG: sensor histidine kinase, partial [Deltaproteobacteria bacterium]|nr:sensor histidine kinase [Deltaproteobacteria bacterium]
MERGMIEADPRHTVRRIKTAMQGNAIRALVELITNADDSYIRLEEEKKTHKGLIEVLYKKEGYRGLFAVRDHAEGMSVDDVGRSFKKYGAATSGMKTGKRVRGYFGQGAKDALASMVDGRVCTFKDGRFVEYCE